MSAAVEHSVASASLGILGPSAVGKEELSTHYVAPALKLPVVNTGKSIRAATYLAHTFGLFESGQGNALRLRSSGIERIREWAVSGNRGLHYEVHEGDPSTHIWFGTQDLTDVLQPQQLGFTQQSIMEPAAALVASNPKIRRSLYQLWRTTAIGLGGAVMITKSIPDYLPEARGKYFLFVSDPAVSARYRIKHNVAATHSLSEEIAYIRHRDQVHRDNGFDCVPSDAMRIDMTPFLLRRNGLQEAAEIVLSDCRQRRN